jgi:hypothetical protein
MFKRFIPVTVAALLVFTACTATPTAAPGTTRSSGADARFDEGIGGYGSGNREAGSGHDTGGVATASADSSAVSRGGGAIGSGN